MNRVEPGGWDEVEEVYRRMAADTYRLPIRIGSDLRTRRDDDDGGHAGVREPRRPKPLLPADAVAIDHPVSFGDGWVL